MRLNSSQLIESYLTRTNFFYLYKVNGAATDAHAPMVFATQLRKLNLDKKHPAYLDGKAKTIYAQTQAAT